ncbi:MAG: hypothetical protein KKB51_03020 [Candidatus Riflebacteria bacterium]|nr:hypothetical protein [Candidatus Riflebacteria bacterium]
MAEILIAAAISALLFTGTFSIYRSGSESFLLGDWKINSQKSAQRFLAVLSTDLNQANNAISIASASSSVAATTPIYVKSTAFYQDGDAPKALNIQGPAWVPLLFFSVSRPNVLASEFTAARPGLWKGVSLWGKDGKLIYTKTGNTTKYSTIPGNIPSNILSYMPPGVSPTGAFRPSTEDYSKVLLEDVETVSFREKTRSNDGTTTERVIQITFSLRRARLGNATSVVESSDASILNDVDIEPF